MVSELVGTLELVFYSDRIASFLCPKRFRGFGCMRCFPAQIRRPDPEHQKWAAVAAGLLLEIRGDLRERSESITRKRQIDQV
jgi:hypothetical protein